MWIPEHVVFAVRAEHPAVLDKGAVLRRICILYLI